MFLHSKTQRYSIHALFVAVLPVSEFFLILLDVRSVLYKRPVQVIHRLFTGCNCGRLKPRSERKREWETLAMQPIQRDGLFFLEQVRDQHFETRQKFGRGSLTWGATHEQLITVILEM